MNKLYALELLGFTPEVDFIYKFGGEIEWLSDEPQPSDAAMKQAWDDWDVSRYTQDVESKKDRAKLEIDSIAEAKRLEYITNGSGQILVYNEKVKEATLFSESGYVESEKYPFISKEASSIEKTPKEVADSILAKSQQWAEVGSSIEALRLKAKKDIESATDKIEIDSVLYQYQVNIGEI